MFSLVGILPNKVIQPIAEHSNFPVEGLGKSLFCNEIEFHGIRKQKLGEVVAFELHKKLKNSAKASPTMEIDSLNNSNTTKMVNMNPFILSNKISAIKNALY